VHVQAKWGSFWLGARAGVPGLEPVALEPVALEPILDGRYCPVNDDLFHGEVETPASGAYTRETASPSAPASSHDSPSDALELSANAIADARERVAADRKATDSSSDSLGRILIADDDDTFRESTAELLREAGYECLCVDDADSAMELLRTTVVDTVIADIRMPGNTHLEALSRLRETGCDAPTILVTGFPSVGSAVKSLNLGVSGYLVKPIEASELYDLVRRSVDTVHGIRRIRGAAAQLNNLADDAEGMVAGGGRATAIDGQGPTRMALELAVENIIGLLLDLKGDLQPPRPGQDSAESVGATAADVAASIPPALAGVRALTPREREVLVQLVAGDRVSSIARELKISQNTVRNHLKSIFRKLKVKSQVELLDRLKAARSLST
jgi:DNA-binding NarL/FixJ family response regulator